MLQEIRDGQITGVTGAELLELIRKARTFLASKGLKKGDRCGLLAANSIGWVAMDLAIMAEGLIVVPLYFRQAPAELVAMMKDSSPSLICCGDAALRDGIQQAWPEAPPHFLFDEIFAGVEGIALDRPQVRDEDPVTIIYTSGTSGEAKGVVLTAGNVGFMLGCTSARLDQLMGGRPVRTASFITCRSASAHPGSCADFHAARQPGHAEYGPDEDSRRHACGRAALFPECAAIAGTHAPGVDEQLVKTGGIAPGNLLARESAWSAQEAEGRSPTPSGCGWRMLLVFPTIRKKMVGENLKALICGSAPLTPETQHYFRMLGIPVLQVYGLTETTGICTMDDPHNPVPGRVGPAIPGIEMKLGENDEIIVRGPNVFPGYWNRPQQTAEVLRDGWFHTGDQGEMDAAGTWRIVGRIKNLIILARATRLPRKPSKTKLPAHLPAAQQVVVVGNGRGYLSAIVTGIVSDEQVQAALDAVNPQLPHYKQVRAFYVRPEPFSIENGLLTANGKLKRDLISARMKNEIEEMYRVKQAV